MLRNHRTGKRGLREEKNPSLGLLDDFAGCEAVRNPSNLDLNMVPGLRVRHKDNETLHASYTFPASADLFDVNVVFLAFLDWLGTESVCAATITSPFITHRHVPPPLFFCSRFGCYGRKQRSLQ